MDKAALRETAKQRRGRLDIADVSRQLRARLHDVPELVRARHVLLYAALPREVDVLPLTADAAKTWYLPRCVVRARKNLTVHPYQPGDPLPQRGRLLLREPDPHIAPPVPAGILDVVIVPALLVSASGDRLGYGGGYYDRFLPTLRADCVRIAALPEDLVVPELPRELWDVPLDLLVTERGVVRFRSVV